MTGMAGWWASPAFRQASESRSQRVRSGPTGPEAFGRH